MKPTLPTALRWLALAGVLLLAGRAGALIVRQPCVGVADNLDYWRVARPAGIVVEAERKQGHHVVCGYALAAPDLGSSVTTPSLVAWLARPLGWLFDVPAGRLDLRQVGVLYWLASVILLLGGLRLGVSAPLLLLVAWVLYDPGFLLFFNSLYADPALILGLTAAVLLLLADRARVPGALVAALLAAAGALAGFSKMQYAVFPGVLLGACLLAQLFRRRRPAAHETAGLAALLALALAAPLYFLYGPAPRFLDANNYNATFGGIARVAGDAPAALAALGIPEGFRDRQPLDYFAAGVTPDDPVMPHVRRVSRVRLAGLYLQDPEALRETARRLHRELARVRTHPRGTRTRSESGKIESVRTPEQFSVWRSRLLDRIPWWSHLLLAVTALLLTVQAVRNRWRPVDTAALFLLLWVTAQFGVAVLGEGFVNIHQHLLGARLGLDLLLVLPVARLAGCRMTARPPSGASA
jgi:hypothetical protein